MTALGQGTSAPNPPVVQGSTVVDFQVQELESSCARKEKKIFNGFQIFDYGKKTHKIKFTILTSFKFTV